MDKTLNSIGENLLAQLAEEIAQIEDLRSDDVTIDRLIDKTGKKRCFIQRMLFDKVKAGELTCVPCYNPETGRRVNAYRHA